MSKWYETQWKPAREPLPWLVAKGDAVGQQVVRVHQPTAQRTGVALQEAPHVRQTLVEERMAARDAESRLDQQAQVVRECRHLAVEQREEARPYLFLRRIGTDVEDVPELRAERGQQTRTPDAAPFPQPSELDSQQAPVHAVSMSGDRPARVGNPRITV